MRQGKRHYHTGDLGCKTSACLLFTWYKELQLQNHLFHEHSNLIKDEGADVLLLHGLVAVSESLTGDQSLHSDRVNLAPHHNLLLKLVRLRLTEVPLCWSSCLLFLLNRARTRFRSSSLFLLLVDQGEHLENSEEKLALISLKVSSDCCENFISLFRSLNFHVLCKLGLVHALHSMSLT